MSSSCRCKLEVCCPYAYDRQVSKQNFGVGVAGGPHPKCPNTHQSLKCSVNLENQRHQRAAAPLVTSTLPATCEAVLAVAALLKQSRPLSSLGSRLPLWPLGPLARLGSRPGPGAPEKLNRSTCGFNHAQALGFDCQFFQFRMKRCLQHVVFGGIGFLVKLVANRRSPACLPRAAGLVAAGELEDNGEL